MLSHQKDALERVNGRRRARTSNVAKVVKIAKLCRVAEVLDDHRVATTAPLSTDQAIADEAGRATAESSTPVKSSSEASKVDEEHEEPAGRIAAAISEAEAQETELAAAAPSTHDEASTDEEDTRDDDTQDVFDPR